jgi:hypothetical protein
MQNSELNQMWLNILANSNERQRRQIAGLKALEFGWGGVSKVCNMTGMSHHTVDKGIMEIKKGKLREGKRIRKRGGGRKKIFQKNKNIKKYMTKILKDNTAGDPMKFLKWTNKSLQNISKELKELNQATSRYTVRRELIQQGYTLQSNKKSKESGKSEERDSQFRYINTQIEKFEKKKQPVISVDTKKKELVGEFKNAGRRWMKKGQAEEVNVYDYPSLSKGKAIPYGIYEIIKNNGFVNVGISKDTAEFAVNSISRWWSNIGKKNYQGAKELLICSDCGGSNGNKNRLWKYCLNKFAKKNNLKVSVCHYPPGTSKWNKIEHKMFSFISMNWKGKPLIDYEVIVNLIQGTKTEKGLKIKAKLDKRKYKRGKKIADKDFNNIGLKSHSINPNWNYSIQ